LRRAFGEARINLLGKSGYREQGQKSQCNFIHRIPVEKK